MGASPHRASAFPFPAQEAIAIPLVLDPAKPILKTERLVLRLPEQRDVRAIVEFYTQNRSYLEPFEPRKSPDFFTHRFWEGCVVDSHREFVAGQSVRTFLFDRRDNETVVGYLGLIQIVRRASWCGVIGYSLAEHLQGRGLMTEALEAAIDYYFRELQLHRVMANYMPHNTRSGRLLRRLGFVVEGYARDYLLINGVWEDHVLTSRLNPDWRPG